MSAALAIAVVLAQQPVELFENTTAFTKLDVKDGISLSKRAIKDSKFFEYRAETDTAYSVSDLCGAVFEWGTVKPDSPGLTLSKVLVEGETERVVYNQITKPVVARRDYAITVKQERMSDTQCRIRFWTTNALAPTVPDGFVRMDHVWGEWIFVAAEKGSRLTYTLFSDPAGSVPAFLVHGPQASATREAATIALRKTKAWADAAAPKQVTP